jgi:hypothetical protein
MTATTPVRINNGNAPGAPVKAKKCGYTTPERPSNGQNTVPGAPRKRRHDVINRDVIDIPFALVLFPEEDICHAPKKPRRVISEIENFGDMAICLFPGDDYDSELDGSDTDSELGGYDSELDGYDLDSELDGYYSDSELDGYDLDSELDGYYSDIELETLRIDFSSDDE